MQRLDPSTLQHMEGIVYEVVQAHERLFVIRKVRRERKTGDNHLATYYVLEGIAYQAPNVFAVCSTKIVRFHLIDEYL